MTDKISDWQLFEALVRELKLIINQHGVRSHEANAVREVMTNIALRCEPPSIKTSEPVHPSSLLGASFANADMGGGHGFEQNRNSGDSHGFGGRQP